MQSCLHINGKPWNKTPPAPRLPDEVIAKTAAKYEEALTRLMVLRHERPWLLQLLGLRPIRAERISISSMAS